MGLKIADINTVFGFFPKRKVDCSLERLRSLLERHCISKALTISLKAAFYDYKEGNEETLEACRKDPRLLPAASVDPRAYLGEEDKIEELRRRGFKAIRIFNEFQGYPPDYGPLLRLIENLEGKGLPLVVCNTGYGFMTKIVRETKGLGYPVVILGCSYDALSEFIVLSAENPHLYIETSQLTSPDAFEVLVEKVGSNRIIFGSGIPLIYFKAAYMMIEKAKIPEEDKEAILHRNFERLMRGGK
jgi:predicted TIM-barrel fold metal-dependent hydrolase